jgi:4-hydroxyphenylpyruvate dioxygenase
VNHQTLGIQGYDYVEYYVGSAKMTAYWFAKALGFEPVGYLGPETGVRDRTSYYMVKNDIRFVVTSALQPGCWDVQQFQALHGDGIKRFALRVLDVKGAFGQATERGAIPLQAPRVLKDEAGFVEQAAIRIYDDTELCFVDRSTYDGVFMPGFAKPVQKISLETEETGLEKIDHIVGNVRENEMNLWAEYFNRTLDFETFLEFGPGDISTQYSALLSKVVKSKDNLIKNPINEPYEGIKKSQIEEYIDQYHGTGVQHIALATRDIVKTVLALRRNGVEFLRVPKTYYETLRKRKAAHEIPVTENIDDLENAGILCDVEGTGYLLQLFTKPVGDRPTFFFEVIQRREGAEGFGQGNFQALFESIERDQKLRGNLDR